MSWGEGPGGRAGRGVGVGEGYNASAARGSGYGESRTGFDNGDGVGMPMLSGEGFAPLEGEIFPSAIMALCWLVTQR